MRILATVVLVAACSFEPGSYGTAPDATIGPTADADAAEGETVARTCKFPDPDLRLCIELDDRTFAPKVTDASAARLDAQTTNVNEAAHAPGYAAAMAFTSRIDVPEAKPLDITSELTIEMWIWPALAHSANLLVNPNQYTVQLAGDGRIGCLLPNGSAWSSDTVAPQQWAHIACTYGGETLAVFVNGVRREVGDTSAVLSGAGMQGTRIGGGYGGAVDDIRVYARALSADEVCTHAGRTTDCPSS